MAETVTNLKVRFGADTKNFKADLESGKAAVDNFSGSAKDAFSEFASVFGVNLSEIGKQISNVQKSLSLLSGGFKGAAAGSGILSGALKALRLAFISTGIGALVVALGSLVTYFTRTERGAEAIQRVMAGFKAAIDVLLDRFAVFGEGIYKIFTGQFKDGWETLKNSVRGVGTEIVNESKAAYALEDALQNLEDKENDLITVQAKRKEAIEELRLKAKDLELSEKERQKAMGDAIAIQKQITADEISIQKERVRIMTEKFNMEEKTDEKYKELQEARARLNEIEAEGTSGIRGMMREYNSLTKSINEAASAERIAAIEKEKSESKDFKALSSKTFSVDPKTGKIAQTEIPAPKVGGFETDKLEASAAKIKSIYDNVKGTTIAIGSEIQSAMSEMAVSFGENLGLMLAGADGAKSINEVLGSVFGEMLVNIGKAAIAAGTAFLAIGEMFKVGITTPGAAIAAIAAGIAMVAVGTAFKSAVSSAASGGGTYSSSSGSSYGSGSYGSSASSQLRSAPQTVYVTGEFRLKNGDLVAAIDKNHQRKIIST